MKKLLFIDHKYHEKTKSADFFVDILRRHFSVGVHYLQPGSRVDYGVLKEADTADVIVLWQLDFLSPLFLAMGKPVITIPMFDGSGGMPDLHWIFAQKARFFNFCLNLNERIRMCGCETQSIRFYPEPVAESELPSFDELNVFFWQRRPDHGIDYALIDDLVGDQIDSLHLHNAPDLGSRPRVTPNQNRNYKYTESTWFRDRSAYVDQLGRSNVFVAPRVAEGIGMALLEAMAQGKLVLAHDAPTNNEYVANGVNGILFDAAHHRHMTIDKDSAARMARTAWMSVVVGRKAWIESEDAIVSWIDGAEAPERLPFDPAEFYAGLWNAYYSSLDEYMSFLTRNVSILAKLAKAPLFDILESLAHPAQPEVAATKAVEYSPLCDGVLDLTLIDDRYTGEGWSNSEEEWRWAVGRKADIHFSTTPSTAKKRAIEFVASSLPELGKSVQCTILLNEKIVFSGAVSPGWATYQFEVDSHHFQSTNDLTLYFDKSSRLPTDSRDLAVCFKQFRIED